MMTLFPLSKSQKAVLKQIAMGDTLKSHRVLDGEKTYRLHSLSGRTEPVSPKVVRALLRGGFVLSNQKFPVATFLLTQKGRDAVTTKNGEPPLTARPSE